MGSSVSTYVLVIVYIDLGFCRPLNGYILMSALIRGVNVAIQCEGFGPPWPQIALSGDVDHADRRRQIGAMGVT